MDAQLTTLRVSRHLTFKYGMKIQHFQVLFENFDCNYSLIVFLTLIQLCFDFFVKLQIQNFKSSNKWKMCFLNKHLN